MRIDVGIIGGTGVGDRLLALGGSPLHIPTPAGTLRGRRIEREGLTLLVIGRHSAGHKVPPHRVNYQAMAYGMRQLGAKGVLATAAVGSLRPEWGPGTLVACSDFLDLTFRNLTLFDREVVHRDFSHPFGPASRSALLHAGGEAVKDGGVYVCGNGPRYETPQEIQTYKGLGGDLVGMTAASEAILMREAGVDYACLAVVTNLAAGISPTPLDHGEVVDEMTRSGEAAVGILLGAAARLAGRGVSLPQRTFALLLAMTPGIGGRSVVRVLARNTILGRSPEEFLSLSPEVYREEYRLTQRAASALAEDREGRQRTVGETEKRLSGLGVTLVTAADAHYPTLIEEMDPDPPGSCSFTATSASSRPPLSASSPRGTPLPLSWSSSRSSPRKGCSEERFW